MKLVVPLLPALAFAAQGSNIYDQQADAAVWGGECPTGKRQSPINIETSQAVPSCASKDALNPHRMIREELLNKSFKVKLNDVNNVNGKTHDFKYTFETEPENAALGLRCAQWHYHFENSEHKINDGFYFGEQHVVCYRSSFDNLTHAALSTEHDALAVFGFFVEEDATAADHPAIAMALEDHEQHTADPSSMGQGVIDMKIPFPADLASSSYFRYMGGLTAGTCLEVVKWTVFENTIKISTNQANFIRDNFQGGGILTGNNRMVQGLNNRTLIKYELNEEAIKDNTIVDGWTGQISPSFNDDCATALITDNFGILSQVYWKPCANDKDHTTWKFEHFRDGYGQIRAVNADLDADGGRCWSIVRKERAGNHPIVLKRCKDGKDDRQMFKFNKGYIWLEHVGEEGQMFCVPWMGHEALNDRLKSKKCWMGQF